MDQCAHCGHALGVGRYCVNCGQPHDAAPGTQPSTRSSNEASTGHDAARDVTATAERPAVRAEDLPTPPPPPYAAPDPSAAPRPTGPAAPPPVYETPRRPRFPMYADDPPPPPSTPSTPLPSVAPVAATASPDAPASATDWDAPTTAPTAPLRQGHAADRGARRTLLPWVAVAVALLLVAGTGVFLLLGGPGGDGEQADDPAGDVASATDPGTSAPPSSEAPTSPTEPASPSTTPAGPVRDLAGSASVEAPTTADPGVDVDGNPVRYDAANMLDGRDDTAWRTPGSAAGQTIVLTLDGPTRLTSVGLVNGYDKTDPGYDGYTANRRVLEVEWEFDDGSRASQVLGDSREVQTLKVDVVTTTVRMRLVTVSDPARAPRGRNFTAISTVALVGAPDAG